MQLCIYLGKHDIKYSEFVTETNWTDNNKVIKNRMTNYPVIKTVMGDQE